MFFSDRGVGFAIIGVYKVNGEAKVAREKGRTHTAISYRIKGNSRIICGKDQILLSDGAVAFFPSGVDYVRETYSAEEYIVIHLSAFGQCGGNVEAIGSNERVSLFFETMFSEWERGNYNRCMSILYRIFEELGQIAEKPCAIPDIIAPGVEEMSRRFRESSLTVAELAKACHISETYFRKTYASYFGRSPSSALVEMRFEYAKSLLSTGYYRVKEASAMAGFSDVKYFRTAFKKKFGITVGEFVESADTGQNITLQ